MSNIKLRIVELVEKYIHSILSFSLSLSFFLSSRFLHFFRFPPFLFPPPFHLLSTFYLTLPPPTTFGSVAAAALGYMECAPLLQQKLLICQSRKILVTCTLRARRAVSQNSSNCPFSRRLLGATHAQSVAVFTSILSCFSMTEPLHTFVIR